MGGFKGKENTIAQSIIRMSIDKYNKITSSLSKFSRNEGNTLTKTYGDTYHFEFSKIPRVARFQTYLFESPIVYLASQGNVQEVLKWVKNLNSNSELLLPGEQMKIYKFVFDSEVLTRLFKFKDRLVGRRLGHYTLVRRHSVTKDYLFNVFTTTEDGDTILVSHNQIENQRGSDKPQFIKKETHMDLHLISRLTTGKDCDEFLERNRHKLLEIAERDLEVEEPVSFLEKGYDQDEKSIINSLLIQNNGDIREPFYIKYLENMSAAERIAIYKDYYDYYVKPRLGTDVGATIISKSPKIRGGLENISDKLFDN